MEPENIPEIQQQNELNENSTLNDGLQNNQDLSASKNDDSTLKDESTGSNEICVGVSQMGRDGDDNSALNDCGLNDPEAGESDKNKLELEMTKVSNNSNTLNDDVKDLSKGGNCDLNKSKLEAAGELSTLKEAHDPTSEDQMTAECLRENEQEVGESEKEPDFLQISENLVEKDDVQSEKTEVMMPSSERVHCSDEVGEASGTSSESKIEIKEAECASVDQKQTPPTPDMTNPAPLTVAPPTLDQTTPTLSENPLSFQTAPSDAETPFELPAPTSDQAPPSSAELPSPAPCLRGYLLKRGGALKAWKQRWFVFEEDRNSLVYYRTPRDVTPLGQVCLSYASFTCEGAEPGVFYLHTPERTVALKAQSDKLKFYWLQQLQLQRWIRTPTKDMTEAELFPQLQCSKEVNTEEVSSQPLLLQFSLKHPFIELQNSLKKRSSTEVSQSVFHIPTPPPTPPTTSSANHSAGKAPATGSKATNDNKGDSTAANRNTEVTLTNQNTGIEEESRKEESSVSLSKDLTTDDQDTRQDLKSTKTKSISGHVQTTPTPSKATPTPPKATPTPSKAPSTTAQTSTTLGHVTLRRRSRSFLRRNTSSWTERSRLQQELQDQKDLVAVLQKALNMCQSEKRSSRLDQQDHNQTEEDRDLRRRLLETQVQLEDLQTSLNQKDQIIKDLKKEIRELSEKNIAKQQVIEKLSLSVTQWSEQNSDVDLQSVQTLILQNQNLQDDLRAFRNQNYFLNSEIHHLSGLWRTSTEGQRVLMNKASVQREQHLRFLRELQEVSLRDGPQSEALRRLLQDTLNQEQSQEHSSVQVNRERDQYGFPLVQHFEVEDITLLAKIQAPDLRTQQNQDAIERPLVARWEQHMSSCRGNLSASPELKNLIRTGIPSHFRPQVWNWIIRTRTQRDQDPLQYQQVCEQMESTPQSRPWSRQIDLDLPRTLCTNHNFSSPSSPALQQLRRILLAFSWENPSIGYCQGLNRIAGLLLLVLESEEDTFWGLKAVVENIMPPDYFTPSLVASQADQLVLKDFLSEKLPRLSSHVDKCGVDVSSATFTWFLVVFVEVLPSHILLPLWDTFLYEGSKVLFRFCLAMFKMKEPEILQLSTNLELYQYFRILPKTVLDYRRLSTIAFDELNPFSRRAVKNRRTLHLERLQRELCELRRQQQLFMSQRSLRKSTDEEEGAEGAKEEEEEEVFDNNSEDEYTVSCI
ncbi:TBC1 domain family member 2A-like isoform X2 [Boleophthalmus pectinirostris]|uniref:TBC1 domain family member 2A-like isoform X2 n=1 Tax=Boleophthalmus pectinirostris TaxID=150288 RepID=UPI00242F1F69|nr:TBC1 domain family member 2A-like isoform X2 [Boleophthalmus pectinirostris]